MGFNGTSIVPISAPFLLTMEGETKPFIPNQDQREQITFFRKYPKSLGTAEMEARIIGGQVQSSHYPDFREAVTHYEISDPAYPDLIQIESNSAYRYWRYLGPPKSYCNIAEFQLFSNDSLMRGTIIGTVGVWKGQTYYSQPFDNDYLTYYHSAEDQKNEAWVGLDFGVPVSVDHVRCVPRSDGNAIQYGDTYELNYWHENKWTPLGTQEARDKNVSFDSVPRNALLLLKNLTHGQEERIFMYENNKQVWL